MLVNRTGTKLFNDFDLDAILRNQLSKVQKDIELKAQSSEIGAEDSFVSTKMEEYWIEPIELKLEDITASSNEKMIRAEYFPSSFWVDKGQSYPKEVLSFHIPFKGDENLLRSVPSTRVLRTIDVLIQNGEISFDVINFNNSAEQLQKQKDDVVSYLKTQSQYVNNQVNQYNSNLEQMIRRSLNDGKKRAIERSEMLAKLGVPLKTEATIRKEVPVKKISSSAPTKEFDVFICHASEDKNFVDKLAEAIRKAGMEVWYDTFQLGWGDDLRPEIDKGLKNSKYGIVVFSKAFLAKKKWTEYELNNLFAQESDGNKLILPIWHDVTRDELLNYSPAFADRLAKKSDSIDEIMAELKMLLQKKKSKGK